MVLANEMGESTNSIRKELNHLHGAGYLEKVKIYNKVEYKANTKHPLFEVLQKVVLKHLGLEDIVERYLDRMGNVNQIILIGDYAKGNDSGLIEIFLIGKDLKYGIYISTRKKNRKFNWKKSKFLSGIKISCKC